MNTYGAETSWKIIGQIMEIKILRKTVVNKWNRVSSEMMMFWDNKYNVVGIEGRMILYEYFTKMDHTD